MTLVKESETVMSENIPVSTPTDYHDEDYRDQSFRDNIATVNEKGQRNWIYAQKPEGKFYDYRTYFSYFQFLVLFALPFIKVDGHPLILLNVLERKFIIFGYIFWPQDLFLFALTMITVFVSLVLLTSALGRVFCGWLCPQTLFLEMLFRKIEFAIEGSPFKQKKLDNGPWTKEKIWKKALKHSIFFGLTFLISNLFLAYIIGVDELWIIVTDPPSQHIVGLISILIFSFVFYGVYIWFREQICLIVCPYGRLQSVMQDPKTITVTYDFARGEPRGKGKKRDNMGDCIDCHQCVHVCPTGIDIRNGLQLECVNCTACMDACDKVMTKTKRPTGLIRYASHEMIEGKKYQISNRVKGYFAVWLVLACVTGYFMSTRSEIHTIIARVPGSVYHKLPGEKYSNVYSLQLLNKTFEERTYHIRLLEPEGEIQLGAGTITVMAQGLEKRTFLIVLPETSLKGRSFAVRIGIFEGDRLVQKITSNFVGKFGKLEHQK